MKLLVVFVFGILSASSCKSDDAGPAVATPATLEDIEPASAKPARPKAEADEELEPELDAHCEMISRDPEMPPDRVRVDHGQVLVEEPVFFEEGTSTILVSSYGVLNEIAYHICKTPEIKLLEIGVHTDPKGSSAYNLKVSQQKADALLEYISDFIEPERLRAKGYGESQPISDGSGPEDHARNRRVEFVIVR